MQPSQNTPQNDELQPGVPTPAMVNSLGNCSKESCRSMGEFLRQSGRADDLYLLNFMPTSPPADIVPTKD